MTVFPAVSEAFTLNEMLAVEDEGLEVIPISLAQPRDPLAHGDARLLASRAMYLCRNPLKVLRANVTFVLRSPRPYLQALAYTVTGHRVSWFSLERGRSAAWKALLLFPFLVEIALRLKAKQVRHVHASMAAISGTAAIILARLLAKTFSMTGHHGDLWFYPPDDLRLRIESASFFTTVAEYNRRRLLQIYPSLNPSLVHVVRLGVPLDRFLPGPRPPRPTDMNRPPILLTVARLDPLKGYDTLLEAARALSKRGLDFRWLVVGDGPMRRLLEEAVVIPPLNGRIRLLGFKSQEDIMPLFQEASVFVLPSRSEGLPVVLMEALACGTACVSTSVNGVPEILHHDVNGLLIPSGDPEALADAVERLLRNDGLRERLATAARPSVVENFDIRETGRRMAELLRGSTDAE